MQRQDLNAGNTEQQSSQEEVQLLERELNDLKALNVLIDTTVSSASTVTTITNSQKGSQKEEMQPSDLLTGSSDVPPQTQRRPTLQLPPQPSSKLNFVINKSNVLSLIQEGENNFFERFTSPALNYNEVRTNPPALKVALNGRLTELPTKIIMRKASNNKAYVYADSNDDFNVNLRYATTAAFLLFDGNYKFSKIYNESALSQAGYDLKVLQLVKAADLKDEYEPSYGNFDVSMLYELYQRTFLFLYYMLGTLALGETIIDEVKNFTGYELLSESMTGDEVIADISPLMGTLIYGGSFLALRMLVSLADSLEREQADAAAILIAHQNDMNEKGKLQLVARGNEFRRHHSDYVANTTFRKKPSEYQVGLPRELANYASSVFTLKNGIGLIGISFTLITAGYATPSVLDFSQDAINSLANNPNDTLRIFGDTLEDSTLQNGVRLFSAGSVIALSQLMLNKSKEVAKFVLPVGVLLGSIADALGIFKNSGYSITIDKDLNIGIGLGAVAGMLLGAGIIWGASYLGVSHVVKPKPLEVKPVQEEMITLNLHSALKARETLTWVLDKTATSARHTLFGVSTFLLVLRMAEQYAQVNLLASDDNNYGNLISLCALGTLIGSNELGWVLSAPFNQGVDRGGFNNVREFLKGLGATLISPGIPAVLISLAAAVAGAKVDNEKDMLLAVSGLLFAANLLTPVTEYATKKVTLFGMSGVANVAKALSERLSSVVNEENQHGLVRKSFTGTK